MSDRKRGDDLDPASVLDLEPDAGDDEVRAAYLRLIKEHPPERDPAAFERIRDAYDALRDPGRRARSLLLSVDPDAPLARLLESLPRPRSFVGPGPWLEEMRKAVRRG
jgi:curved DNA-binding protein CbpA